MKNFLFRAVPLSFLVLFSGAIFAQQEIADFLQGGVGDAKKLGNAYLEPFGKMFGTSLNGGWYQAAAPHKLFGFDITFTTSIVTAPSSAKTFDVNDLNLDKLIVMGSNSIAPTISGSSSTVGPKLAHEDAPNVPLFTLPKGGGLPLTPMMLIQGSIGLPFHSELTVRFLPPVNVPKMGRVVLWGVGAKNEFKEFIPGLKHVPIDLSIMVGYTKFSSEFDVNYKPDPANMPEGYTSSDFDGQKIALDASGFTARLLVGKSIPILSVYAGLGYSTATSDFGLKGNYPIGVEPNYVDVINDPFVLAFTNSNFSANAGFRIRLSVISLNFDYTVGDYAMYTAGLGISFR
jgi:hypothetical protein